MSTPDEPVVPQPEPTPPTLGPHITREPARVEIGETRDAAPLPGAHRGGFSRAFTGPVGITIESAPIKPGSEEGIAYTPAEYPTVPLRQNFSPWALAFAIVGLGVALFVGWAFLLGIAAIVAAVIGLRRRENRALCIWAIALAGVSLVYSTGWLVWDAMRAALVGG